MREVLNAILYLAEGGIAWRMLPKDFPPVSTVRRYFYQWRDDGTLCLDELCIGYRRPDTWTAYVSVSISLDHR